MIINVALHFYSLFFLFFLLNRYGFHKVNKSPRGSKGGIENQLWEFSHPKFTRDRPDRLDDIKRKPIESDMTRRESGDIHAHLQLVQMQQSDMAKQIQNLQANLSEALLELSESRRKQAIQQHMMKNMMDFMKHQQNYQGIFLNF